MHETIYLIPDFLKTTKKEWLRTLSAHVKDVMGETPGNSQIKAWEDCYDVLQREFIKSQPLEKTYLVFEYELKRERGRRPDVIMLHGNTLYVLEFKQHNKEHHHHLDQVMSYARDLQNYHHFTHSLKVKSLLILTGAKDYCKIEKNVLIISGDRLHSSFLNKLNPGKEFSQSIKEWFSSPYEPLPTIIAAAKIFFEKRELPQINRALSAGIPNTLQAIQTIINNSNKNSYNLILLTGVPGAGKTLVGLKYVHGEKNKKATFLSGNGPLVNVLQATLGGNKTFVQGLLGFKKTYSAANMVPREDVIVFDEAQRTWNSARMQKDYSEPALLISIAEKKAHFTIIALIGEGQEIHIGEEEGVRLWDQAIESSAKNKWNIFGPEKLLNTFTNNYTIVEHLDLTMSLRTHTAESLQSFVNAMMNNDLEIAKNKLELLYNEGYVVYLTRKLDSAKSYVKSRYDNEEDKTYGLISSSIGTYLKKRELLKKGFGNEVNYFVHTECKKCIECATEFACQGLELDFPIICWDDDLKYNNSTFAHKT